MTNLDWFERISEADVTATAVGDFPGVNRAAPVARNINAPDVHVMIAAFQAHKRVPTPECIKEILGVPTPPEA
jgi:hypothetical protein